MKAIIGCSDSGIYWGEIKYDDGNIEAITASTTAEVHKFFKEHNVKYNQIELKRG